ncbi:endoglucanase E-4 [Hyalella azteca]|uniref:cellulase n=1 Tax=Hyalella azteca TaxID=294128 RepID=A0A8B7NSX4_HYAAZ|nr:endoglucanase E-4 [Hyalella azteca]
MKYRALFVLTLLVAGSSRSEAVGYCGSHGGSPYDYRELLCHALVFYEANRSGYLPSDQRVEWRGDSALNDGADNGVNLEGGYYDAGDLVKFGFPLAYTVTFLSWGYITYGEGYVQAGQTQYLEKTIKWATDFILKAHTTPTTIWAQVGDGDLDHSLWGPPEDMTMARPSYKLDQNAPGSEVAAESAAGLAAASIVFKNSNPSYSATLLQAAKELFDFANNYREMYTNSLPEAADFYVTFGYGDELTWGAIWLYRATGDDSYRALAEQLFTEFDVAYGASFSWENKKSGCIALFAELLGGNYLNILQSNAAELRNFQTTPGGLHYFQHWGSLRYALNHGFIAFRAADLGLDTAANNEFGERQINYALGSNPRSSSYVVGVGNNPPTHCHHRAASCPGPGIPCGWDYGNSANPNPHILYGALVGGPDQNDGYTDERQNWEQNEVGCDYNAALAANLARMITHQPL